MFAALAIVGGLLLVWIQPGYAGEAAQPTVTFTGGASAPLICPSRPDIASLTVNRGRPVILANRTGVDATVDIGAEAPLTVPNGSGLSIKLSVGTHVLRMVPQCLILGEVGQTVLIVNTGPPPGPEPVGTAGPSGNPTVSSTTGSSGAPGSGSSRDAGPAGVPPSGGASGGPGDGDGGPGGPPPDRGFGPGGFEETTAEVVAVAVDRNPDRHGIRLLGIVAAICAIGVTAGIIRAIVTHRARGTSRT